MKVDLLFFRFRSEFILIDCAFTERKIVMRILVAEDERDLNRLICQTLERAGYSVDACYDGESALDYHHGADYDCLLLDIMMPKKDGHAVLQACGRKEALRR